MLQQIIYIWLLQRELAVAKQQMEALRKKGALPPLKTEGSPKKKKKQGEAISPTIPIQSFIVEGIEVI